MLSELFGRSWPLQVTVLLVALQWRSAARAVEEQPCPFADTVNVTGTARLEDGSYEYAGLVVAPNATADYAFKVIDGIEYAVAPHTRACVCHLRPCVSLCCPPAMRYDAEQRNCSALPHGVRTGHTDHIEVLQANGSLAEVSLAEAFLPRIEFSCRGKAARRLTAWNLLENGTLLGDGRLWSADEYCLTPLAQRGAWTWTPLTCERAQRGWRVWIYAICTTLAILGNVFIFALLVCVGDVRSSDYGELLVFYTGSFLIGLTALLYLSLKEPATLAHTACRNIGFLAYFFLMLSFLFVSVISWDFWRSFRLRRWCGWRRKLLYGGAVALAFALKFVAKYAQDSSGLPPHLKPGIGEGHCWFDQQRWGLLLFYYAPILLALSFSLGSCACAYCALRQLPKDTRTVAGGDVSAAIKHFRAFFVYLLCVSAAWLRELIVHLVMRPSIDFWSGICLLALAVVGFVCLLHKNVLLQRWWRRNISNTTGDYVYRLPARSAHTHTHKTSERRDSS